MKHKIADAVLQVGTFCLLCAITIALKLYSYKKVARHLPSAGSRIAAPWRKRQLLRHIERASRFVPGANCLPQALTGYVLLACRGLDGRIRIGVLNDEDAGFRAHATLIIGDDVVIGAGGDAERFTPLTDLRPGR